MANCAFLKDPFLKNQLQFTASFTISKSLNLRLQRLQSLHTLLIIVQDLGELVAAVWAVQGYPFE